MSGPLQTRREFAKTIGFGTAALLAGGRLSRSEGALMSDDAELYIKPDELKLRCLQAPGRRALSFERFKGTPEAWRKTCREKLVESLGFTPPAPAQARRLRTRERDGVRVEAWILEVSSDRRSRVTC